MRELIAALLFVSSGAAVGFTSGYFMATLSPKCACQCCTPDEKHPHRPLRPNGSMPGKTGSMGSLDAK